MGDSCNLPGQLVNFHKSSIFFFEKFSNNRKTTLANQFNILPKSSLGRYLGIFFSSYNPTKADLNHIAQKSDKKIIISGSFYTYSK